MLGQAVAAQWQRHGAAVRSLSRDEADIQDGQRLLDHVADFRPQVVVNCAAFTKVDACEEQQETAMAVNGTAVANVAAAAADCDARLIHISTDYVFDGTATAPYVEGSSTAPMSVYGASKLRGEQEALRSPNSLVLRASWLFGPGGPNFAATMVRLIRQGKLPLRVVHDQVGCPTYTPFLAKAIWDLAPLDVCGAMHYRNRDPVSWYEFTVEIARAVDADAEVLPVTTDEFPRPAPRPAYSVLDVDRFEQAVGRPVEPWIDGLSHYLDILGNDTLGNDS